MSRLLLIRVLTEVAERGGGGGHEGRPEIANFITLLNTLFHGEGLAGVLLHYQAVVFAWMVVGIVALFAYLSSRNRRLVPGSLQNLVEMVVEGLYNFFVGILGPQGEKLVPFLGTLFVYIFIMNIFGLVPGMFSSTSNLNVTLALAICVFVYVQYIGIRRNGLLGYLWHMAGSPRSLVEWVLVPLNLPIHILGELARPVSLSLRLFGNVTGEDVLIAAFVGLGIVALSFLKLPVGLPLHVPFIFLAILTSLIQALVFALLSTVYFSLMLPHEEEHS
ncbi:MAG: F0F1 ATP synthase subunit A [Candidatus Zixiibacteriota bacterium]